MICKHCGIEFEPYRKRQQFCGKDECSKEYRKQWKERNGRKHGPRPCAICGKEFDPPMKISTVCSDPECKLKHEAERQRKAYQQKKEKKFCIICGGVIKGQGTKYCSRQCVGKAQEKEHEAAETRERAYYPEPLRRPFTSATRLMISQDIKAGRSFEWMARMYGRDAEHIREEVGRWQARL